MRYAKSSSHRFIAHQATGVAMTIAMATSFTKSMDSNRTIHKLLMQLGPMDTLIACALKSASELTTLDTALAFRLKRLDGNIQQLMTAVHNKSGFEFQALQNLKCFCQQVLHFSDEAYASYRDSCMAENVNWLSDTKFAGKKIMVWAANSHVGKHRTNFRHHFTPMGKYLADYYGSDPVYSLAITARTGASGVFKETREIRSHTEGFENAVPDNVDYAFFDFHQSSDAGGLSFYLNALGGGPVKLPWKKHFDGIIYIREMMPSTAIPRKPKSS